MLEETLSSLQYFATVACFGIQVLNDSMPVTRFLEPIIGVRNLENITTAPGNQRGYMRHDDSVAGVEVICFQMIIVLRTIVP